ncbi:MAG: PD40 domain-containing protein [Anaerolineae bacterium]|nr:PD40 domain-containing protein [Anaerolineae bacterium]
MNKYAVLVYPLLMMFLLSGCAATWDELILPEDASLMYFSPNLDWVTYARYQTLWLASLSDLQHERQIPRDYTVETWDMHTYWSPDGTGFLMRSYNRANCLTETSWKTCTETWWLVKVKQPDIHIPLCALPHRERIVVWSPTSTAFAVVDRGGSVIIVQADGSGYQELPIFSALSPFISWSPDGQRIAYTHVPYLKGAEAGETRIINLTTQQTTTVYATVADPIWFPDGELLALVGKHIVITPIDGSDVIEEIYPPEEYLILPSQGSVWSPDGSKLALYLRVVGPNYKPVAIGILNKHTLTFSVVKAPYFHEILNWTSDGQAIIVRGSEQRSNILQKVFVPSDETLR